MKSPRCRENGNPEQPGPRWGNVEFASAVGTGERTVQRLVQLTARTCHQATGERDR